MMKFTYLIGAVACSMAFAATAASAATLLAEPTITFTNLSADNNDGNPVYVEDGFAFDPTSFQAGNCSPFPTANDPCIKEVQQSGVVTTMTPVLLGGTFTLTGFYFDLQGTGGQNPVNQLILSSSKTTPATQFVFQVGQLAPTGAQLYNNYEYLPPLQGDLYNGVIVNNESYFVTIDSALFTDVGFVTWSTFQAQNLRIDDISVAPSVIPLPAAGWLLLAGVGGLAAMRRKKAA